MLGDRSLFPDLEARVYLNHAAISPPSLPVRAACMRALDDYARLGAGAWLHYREQRERLRASLARLCGAEPHDLALVPSTTHGVVYVALCVPWRAGDRIVLFDGDFPTNVTPWQQAAARFGAECVFLPFDDFRVADGRGLERLEETLRRGGARLVAISAVQFQTGVHAPLAEITTLCHRHGAEVFVDAMQAVGAVPVDVRALGVDYLAVGSHKWLMGPEGAGFLYVRPDRLAALEPTVAGWLSHDDPAGFLFGGAGLLRYDRPLRASADFLEIGAMNTLGFAALEPAVELLHEHTVEAIFQHVNGILDRLEQGLLARGFESLRSADPARRSCILGVLPPPDVDLQALWEGLGARGVACSMPDGVLRFAPHWPNDTGQAGVVLGAVDEVLAAAR